MAVALGVSFAGARLLALHADPSRFVVAGTRYVDPVRAPRGLHVYRGDGYDGQFYYRLALDPGDLGTEAHGIRLDNARRRARIAYPALAWVFSGGRASALPWVLIGLNVCAFAALGLVGGYAARDASRHALWGLLLVGLPGLLFALGRDLADVLAAAMLAAGLLLARHRSYAFSGAALAVAAVTRESTLLAPAALAVVWLVRGRRDPGAALAWVLPVAALVAWEAIVYADVRSIPLTADRSNLGAPLAGLLPELVGWASEAGRQGVALRYVELGLVFGFTLLAAASLRRSRAASAEKLAWLIALMVVLCLSRDVWKDPGDFRVVAELWILGVLILLADGRRRLAIPAAACAAVWAAAAVYRVAVL